LHRPEPGPGEGAGEGRCGLHAEGPAGADRAPGPGDQLDRRHAGRPILLADASVTAFWVWLKSKYGFTDSQVRKYAFNSGPFLSDKRVIQQGYVTSEPYTLEKEGHIKPAVFLLADQGYPSYAAMDMQHDNLIENH